VQVSGPDTSAAGTRDPWAWIARRKQAIGVVLALALLVLAGAVRFHRIGAESFWLDEAYTYARAAMTPSEAIQASFEKGHVPTYFLLMHYWLAFGDDEATLRAPSAIFGVMTVAAGMLLGWIAAGLGPALVTGLLVALCPLQVRYGQEARMYTMLTFAATIALCGVLWLLKHPEQAANRLWRRSAWPRPGSPAASDAWLAWSAYVAGAIAALYLHNTAVFLLAACGLCALLQIAGNPHARRPLLANWALANALVLAIWSIWIRSLLAQTDRVLDHFWATFPSPSELWLRLSHLYLFEAQEQPWLAVLLAGLGGYGAFQLRHQRPLLVGLSVLAFATPVLVLLVSLRTPMFLPRIMLWAPIPFFVMIGIGVCALRRPALPAVASLAVLLGGFLSLKPYFEYDGRKPPWRDVAKVVSEQFDNDSLVFTTGVQERTSLEYYYRRRNARIERVPLFTVSSGNRARRYSAGARTLWLLDGVLPEGKKDYAKTQRLIDRLEWLGHLQWVGHLRDVTIFKYGVDHGKQHPVTDSDSDPLKGESADDAEQDG
jgi:mannosyltransferase